MLVKTIQDRLCTLTGDITNKEILLKSWCIKHDFGFYLIDSQMQLKVTALHALPRHPKKEDAGLIYRYASEGIYVRGSLSSDGTEKWCAFKGGNFAHTLEFSKVIMDESLITHAVDKDGNEVEVAITNETV